MALCTVLLRTRPPSKTNCAHPSDGVIMLGIRHTREGLPLHDRLALPEIGVAANASALAQRGPNGQQMVNLVLQAVRKDMAGGEMVSAARGRFASRRLQCGGRRAPARFTGNNL